MLKDLFKYEMVQHPEQRWHTLVVYYEPFYIGKFGFKYAIHIKFAKTTLYIENFKFFASS